MANTLRDAAAERVRWLATEFPTVAVAIDEGSAGHQAHRDGRAAALDALGWLDRRNDFTAFDAQAEAAAAAGDGTVAIEGPLEGALSAAGEMLTRWQRLLDRRNRASSSPLFDAVLACAGALHDRSKPLVVADWNHALDTWQWVLRLDGDAGIEVQLAALLHDIERLESEADARVEHLAPDYVAFKRGHARRGAALALALLEACRADRAIRDRVAGLVAAHEQPAHDPDRLLLNDADALSFFSQNSAGYLDYFGPQRTMAKIDYTVRRMRAPARARVAGVRIRADVQRLLERSTEAQRGGASP